MQTTWAYGIRYILRKKNFIYINKIGSVAYRTANQFGQGTGPILMFAIGCSGQESNLLDCSYRPFPHSTCSHYYDAGVKCEGILI